MSSAADSNAKVSLGWAIASLLFGIFAVLTSVILVGMVFGVLGLLLGVVHLSQRQRSNGLAWSGISLSLLGIGLSIWLSMVYVRAVIAFAENIKKQIESQPAEDGTLTRWQGVVAPDIAVTTLDGRSIRLSELKGKRVILDFWATWCGPCVREIPHFVELRKMIPEDELVIVGISDEDAEDLIEFLKGKNVTYPIASATDLPEPYCDVEGIPTTFFIDRNGVIQNIEVGYRELAQLEQLAKAADFVGDARAAPQAYVSELLPAENSLELIPEWSKAFQNGQSLAKADWNADGQDEILVPDTGAVLHVLNLDGEETETVKLPSLFSQIEVGRHSSGLRLLGYTVWSPKVTVMDVKGEIQWESPTDGGVNNAHFGDLDGDGIDEVIVGYNGDAGIRAFTADGKLLWHFKDIGNVWTLAVVSAQGSNPARVVSTEAGGTVRLFDGAGKHLRTLKPLSQYLTHVDALRDKDGPLRLIGKHEFVVAFDQDEGIAWRLKGLKPGSSTHPEFAHGDLDGDGISEWLFVDITGELVAVNIAGRKLASEPDQSKSKGFLIVDSSDGKLLVTLNAGSITAFKPKPVKGQ